jgi:competence protein ComEA
MLIAAFWSLSIYTDVSSLISRLAAYASNAKAWGFTPPFGKIAQMQNLKTVLYLASGILFGLFLAALVWVMARSPRGEAVVLRPVPTQRPIIVHITGAVPRPGVYALPPGARIQDVISAAGGFLAEAEKSQINLAAPLEDGERLDIPYMEGASPVLPTPGVEVITTELVNINEASAEDMVELLGITSAAAQSIVDNRPYFEIEEIRDLPGIGQVNFARIRHLITVGE